VSAILPFSSFDSVEYGIPTRAESARKLRPCARRALRNALLGADMSAFDGGLAEPNTGPRRALAN